MICPGIIEHVRERIFPRHKYAPARIYRVIPHYPVARSVSVAVSPGNPPVKKRE